LLWFRFLAPLRPLLAALAGLPAWFFLVRGRHC
jgi:hypothetical protein